MKRVKKDSDLRTKFLLLIANCYVYLINYNCIEYNSEDYPFFNVKEGYSLYVPQKQVHSSDSEQMMLTQQKLLNKTNNAEVKNLCNAIIKIDKDYNKKVLKRNKNRRYVLDKINENIYIPSYGKKYELSYNEFENMRQKLFNINHKKVSKKRLKLL